MKRIFRGIRIMGAWVLIVCLLCSVCFAEVAVPAFSDIETYEEYLDGSGAKHFPGIFVRYDMVSVLGDFHYFNCATTPVLDLGTKVYLRYIYTLRTGDRKLMVEICDLATMVKPSDIVNADATMRDMRRLESDDSCHIRNNGLEYTYEAGVLRRIDWEYAGLNFGFEFWEEADLNTDNPVICKLLSVSGEDVKEGLNLLKSHMHKNGFINVTQLLWGGIALVAVAAALGVFFVSRARRAKRKAASACEAPDDLKITEVSE